MKSGLCALTKEPLKKPICICRLGNLYNKEALIQKLVEGTMPKTGFDHIRKIKDVREINPETAENGTILCPLTKKELNGFNKFLAYWECGCVVSLSAVKEIQSSTNKNICVMCETGPKSDSSTDNVIDLNLSDQEKSDLYKILVEKT